MPKMSKRSREISPQLMAKGLARQSAGSTVDVPQPMVADSSPKPKQVLVVEEDPKSTVGIEFKQEPPEIEQMMEVELLNTKEEEELESVGNSPNQQLFQEKEVTRPDPVRCPFCPQQFRAKGGHDSITEAKVYFVLGTCAWGALETQPGCCEGCRNKFDLFYEFKRSCLVALARPEKLGVIESNRTEQCPERKTTGVQTEEFEEIEKRSQQKSPEMPVSDVVDSDIPAPEPEPPSSTAATLTEGERQRNKRHCIRCRKWFANQRIYLRHKPLCIKRNVRTEPPFVCLLCPQKFNRLQELTLHMNKHTGNRKNRQNLLQKRLKEAEAKVNTLTELNINLQKEKLQLMAQNTEQEPMNSKAGKEKATLGTLKAANTGVADLLRLFGLSDHIISKFLERWNTMDQLKRIERREIEDLIGQPFLAQRTMLIHGLNNWRQTQGLPALSSSRSITEYSPITVSRLPGINRVDGTARFQQIPSAGIKEATLGTLKTGNTDVAALLRSFGLTDHIISKFLERWNTMDQLKRIERKEIEDLIGQPYLAQRTMLIHGLDIWRIAQGLPVLSSSPSTTGYSPITVSRLPGINRVDGTAKFQLKPSGGIKETTLGTLKAGNTDVAALLRSFGLTDHFISKFLERWNTLDQLKRIERREIENLIGQPYLAQRTLLIHGLNNWRQAQGLPALSSSTHINAHQPIISGQMSILRRGDGQIFLLKH